MSRLKFRNQPTTVDGINFHSRKEARRFVELQAMERGGLIRDLRRQVWYDLDVAGEHICRYVADFVYYDNERRAEIVEDPKGCYTDVYRIKKRLMKACHGIEIEEP
jgi:hypothetical protein